MNIIYNDFLAKLVKRFGFDAIVIGGVCHTSQLISPGSVFYKHEAKHAEQQKNLGLLFYIQYVLWSIVKGYKNNPFEIESRKAEK